jgi:hypothetical protein
MHAPVRSSLIACSSVAAHFENFFLIFLEIAPSPKCGLEQVWVLPAGESQVMTCAVSPDEPEWEGNQVTLWSGHLYRAHHLPLPFGGAAQLAARTQLCGLPGYIAVPNSLHESTLIDDVARAASLSEHAEKSTREAHRKRLWAPITMAGRTVQGRRTERIGRRYTDPPTTWSIATGPQRGQIVWKGARAECAQICEAPPKSQSAESCRTDGTLLVSQFLDGLETLEAQERYLTATAGLNGTAQCMTPLHMNVNSLNARRHTHADTHKHGHTSGH